MKRFLTIWMLALVVGCESSPEGPTPDAGASSSAVDRTVDGGPPRGLPPDPALFGTLAEDVDRVILTKRTVLARGPDGGLPSGEAAHPTVWETTDAVWIEKFVAAIGPKTARVAAEEPSVPWADLTLYSDGVARGSLAVEGEPGSFDRFRTRPPKHVFVAADPDATGPLLEELTAD